MQLDVSVPQLSTSHCEVMLVAYVFLSERRFAFSVLAVLICQLCSCWCAHGCMINTIEINRVLFDSICNTPLVDQSRSHDYTNDH
jgi:hypothetical protein